MALFFYFNYYFEDLIFALEGFYVQTFLAVHNSSIGLIVPCLLGLTQLTIRVFTTLQSDPRDL